MGDIYSNHNISNVPSGDSGKKDSNLSIINLVGVNLTKLALENRLDPVVGREDEINRIIQILGRRKKNNPILVGEPGVGKTSLLDRLASRIVEGNVPFNLKNKEIYTIEISSLVAGTKYRGEFEERMKSLVKELKDNPNIIIFIDELHTIIGAGSSSGSLDVSNILKPALARGEIRCIGATTYDEFRESIEADGALNRRFQQVTINESSADDTLHILKNIKHKYESFHLVNYSDEILELIVNLADRHITDKYFPDKAIDILDEVGSYKRLEEMNIPKKIRSLEAKLKKAEADKKLAAFKHDYEIAADKRDLCLDIKNNIDAEYDKWYYNLKNNPIAITTDDVLKIISKMSNVPLERLTASEYSRLLKMDSELKKLVIGQDDAIDKICSSIKRNRVGIKKKSGTIGNFIFLGSSGCGKTLLAKKINEYLFNAEDSLIRIDMGDFVESHSVSKLIGSPPGYVGYGEGGHLTEKVRRNPHSVILFDEIEKAHPVIFNTMLQLLDDGYLTDSLGRYIDFRNTLIIMTSNAGSRELDDFGGGIGFGTSKISDKISNETKILNNAINKKFPPEFLNRIDEIIIFNKLSEVTIMSILNKELKEIGNSLSEMGNYFLKVNQSAKKIIIEHGYDSKYGARQLNRTLERLLENPISDKILRGEIAEGDTITVKGVNGELQIKSQK